MSQYGSYGWPCTSCGAIDICPSMSNARLRLYSNNTDIIWRGLWEYANAGQHVEPSLGCDLIAYEFALNPGSERYEIKARHRWVSTGFTVPTPIWTLELPDLEAMLEDILEDMGNPPQGTGDYVNIRIDDSLPIFCVANASNQGLATITLMVSLDADIGEEPDVVTEHAVIPLLALVNVETGELIHFGPISFGTDPDTAAIFWWSWDFFGWGFQQWATFASFADSEDAVHSLMPFYPGLRRLPWSESNRSWFIDEDDQAPHIFDLGAADAYYWLGFQESIPVARFTGFPSSEEPGGWYYTDLQNKLRLIEELPGEAGEPVQGELVDDSVSWGSLNYRCGKIYSSSIGQFFGQIRRHDIESGETTNYVSDFTFGGSLFWWGEIAEIVENEGSKPYWFDYFPYWYGNYWHVVADTTAGGDSEIDCRNACGGPATVAPCEHCGELTPPIWNLSEEPEAQYECSIRSLIGENEDAIIKGTCDGEPIPIESISYITYHRWCSTSDIGAPHPETCGPEADLCPTSICDSSYGHDIDCQCINRNIFNGTLVCLSGDEAPFCLSGHIDSELDTCRGPSPDPIGSYRNVCGDIPTDASDFSAGHEYYCDRFLTVVARDACNQFACITFLLKRDFQEAENCCCYPKLRLHYTVDLPIEDGGGVTCEGEFRTQRSYILTFGASTGACVPVPPDVTCCAAVSDLCDSGNAPRIEARLLAGDDGPGGCCGIVGKTLSGWTDIGECPQQLQFLSASGTGCAWQIRAVNGPCTSEFLEISF